eukprot:CAMPEP_0114996242 /NCGR_PEP_ID=MMETSP0216-20121206/14193_1 /TAXON_ID=223996 /ORGANISM="Protocruzia adherens, Strain Boccale" /LENGTH=322 /DNA_ID=CAMNT_0002360407 /DNA_START=31 /DNA_END=999 /DNA_ORIENTATION=-
MGPYLSQPDKKKYSRDGANAKFRYGASEMQGWRTGMEDAHITEVDFDTDTAFFGVFDGHGGSEVAEFVERHLCSVIRELDSYKNNELGKAMSEGFLKIDELLQTPNGIEEIKTLKAQSKEKEEGNKLAFLLSTPDYDEQGNYRINAGCTANAAFIRGTDLVVANAGDTRSVLCRAGRAVEMSKDHKPDNPEESARIAKAGGEVLDGRVNGNLNLSRSLGDLEFKKVDRLPAEEQMITAFPDLKKETLDRECEFMIIACDGVWDVMQNQEAVDFVRTRLNNDPTVKLSTIVEEIFEHCCAPTTETGLGCDNMTCIIVQFIGLA